ncbi:MAG TPA: hypothetical protein VGH74_16125 [Planctomycetaceae bacterium]|jgi:hypothetical protein
MSETESAVAGTGSPVEPPVKPPVESPVQFPTKRRRPLERALVWALIAGLFALASAESWSRYSYQRAYDFLGDRLEFGDEHTDEALDAAEVKSFLNERKPSRTEDFASARKMMPNGATHLEVYSWFTLNPVHRREMFVYYDAFGPAHKEHPQVLSIQAFEEQFIPLLSQQEQQALEQNVRNGTVPDFNMLPFGGSLPQMSGRGLGRGRPGDDVQPAVQVDPPAEEAGPDSQPEADKVEL